MALVMSMGAFLALEILVFISDELWLNKDHEILVLKSPTNTLQ